MSRVQGADAPRKGDGMASREGSLRRGGDDARAGGWRNAVPTVGGPGPVPGGCGGVSDADRAPRPRTASRLTVLSGPSGVGKSTVVAELRRTCPQIWLSVSVTTRPPRAGEVDGREYRFVDDHEFDRMVAHGELLEWAEFAGHRYGTPRAPLEHKLAAGVPCLLEIDLAGARQVRRRMPAALLVFLAPPSWDELVRRLTGRGTESPEAVHRRLAAARAELAAEHEFDVTIVNTSVEAVCRELISLMIGPAWRCRPDRAFHGT